MAKILAKEVLQSRKAVGKMYASIAQINSVMMSMDHQAGVWLPMYMYVEGVCVCVHVHRV